MTRPEVYLATCAQLPNGDPDTARLAARMRTLGVPTEVAAWDDPVVEWAEASLTVIRSTWDYDTRREEFLRWAHATPTLQNPAPLVQWNTDKQYLLDLPETAAIAPTQILQDPSPDAIAQVLEERGWEDAVLKPAIGLDGHGVSRVKRGNLVLEKKTGVWLLQSFLEEVRTEGEISVMVIEGRPTHAVLRQPADNDFRVQERLGGRVQACDPPADVLAFAATVVDGVSPLPLYARVDLVRRGETLCLMELELVEPSLFLEHSLEGLEAVCAAILARLGSRPSSN